MGMSKQYFHSGVGFVPFVAAVDCSPLLQIFPVKSEIELHSPNMLGRHLRKELGLALDCLQRGLDWFRATVDPV